MRRTGFGTALLLGALGAAGDSRAFTIVPSQDEAGRIAVVIEKPYGDLVPFRYLPPPYDRAVQSLQSADTLSFRWRYDVTRDEGLSYLRIDEDGRAALSFVLFSRVSKPGDALAAAAVLVDRDGRALHAVYARTAVAEGVERYPLSFAFERPAAWWNQVDGVAFFHMKYFALQKLDAAGIDRAMRRAVWRISKGEGTEQWR